MALIEHRSARATLGNDWLEERVVVALFLGGKENSPFRHGGGNQSRPLFRK